MNKYLESLSPSMARVSSCISTCIVKLGIVGNVAHICVCEAILVHLTCKFHQSLHDFAGVTSSLRAEPSHLLHHSFELLVQSFFDYGQMLLIVVVVHQISHLHLSALALKQILSLSLLLLLLFLWISLSLLLRFRF